MNICPNCFADELIAGRCPSCGYEETSAQQNPLYLKPRTLLNQRYLIGNAIGHGGFGITYVSWDLKLERKVAIKEFLPTALATRTLATSGEETRHTVTVIGDQGEAFKIGLKKFLKEAKILAGFTHENIVRVIDYFENYETGYIVMEYVGQENLSQLVKRQPEKRLAMASALEIFFPILNALKVIHANGIYHQDISLANVRMVDGHKPVLIDFGAARYIVGEMSQSIEKVFKPGYSPVEQITSSGKIGPWTDIYACGAMFYAMIIGELPPQSIDRLDRDDLIPPDQKIEISPAINDAVLKALSVRIGDRFQTAEEFETALKTSTPKANKKNRWLAVAWDAFVVVAIITIGIIVFEQFRANQKTPSVNESEVSPQSSQNESPELAQQLRQCQGHFQAGRLTTGEGGTAFACYQAVLKKYPNNTQALTGITNIEARYVEWVKNALKEGQLEKAKRYLVRLRQVNPQSSQLVALEAQLNENKEIAEMEVKLARAEQARLQAEREAKLAAEQAAKEQARLQAEREAKLAAEEQARREREAEQAKIGADADTTINPPSWCPQAKTRVELMICNSNDPELWSLEHQNVAWYKKVKTPQVRREQRQWLKNVRNQCLTIDCLKQVYQQRIIEFIQLDE